ncbi:MAG: pyrimidine reductase family protein [Acidimicrobiales bacterium]|nr:pyrimidine reductase family protein [Acidimicrobiales bacterium]
MRELFPQGAEDADAAERYAADERERPDGAPWVVINMIASADGATAIDGRSGALGGPADQAVFRALRAVPDVILVAAGTVRDEGYGPVKLSAEARRRRSEAGRREVPRLAVVSASLGLDPTAALFTDPGLGADRPLVYTVAAAPEERRRALAEVAEVVVAGAERVELSDVIADLRRRDERVVLCEGGPSLNAQLVADDLVDELCLSVAPMLVGGASARVAQGDRSGATPVAPRHLRLDRVLTADDLLFLRYVRR